MKRWGEGVGRVSGIVQAKIYWRGIEIIACFCFWLRRTYEIQLKPFQTPSMKLPNLILTAFVGTALFGGGSSLEAAQIVGSITFAGGVNLNTSSAGTATAVTAWTGPGGAGSPFVLSSSLSAGAVPSFSSVTFVAPWSFVSGPISSFWSVSGYTFDLLSSGVFSQGGSPASVSVTGTGTLKYAGFTDTPGSWSFSTQDPSSGSPANFSFSSAAGAQPVYDGGGTAMLLGMGFTGLALVRRKVLA